MQRKSFSHRWTLGCLTWCLLGFILMSGRVAAQPIAGSWIGTLNAMGQKLRIVFHIEQMSDTAFSATLDSPDQGVKGIPVPEARWDGKSLVLGVPSIMGKYEGKRTTDTTIAGSWSQGGMSLPLELARTTQVAELRRPQKPVKPYPYVDEDVTFENASAGITLAGTLTKPRSTTPPPCAVMITGSGPQDRNESLFGHDPFHVIADYLTRHGMAVLRFDDRGVGKSKGVFSTATTEDFATDVLAAVSYLRSREDIDPGRIGLIGHSEGGLIAPMVASRTKDVAFMVLLAGTGLPGEEILYLQQELISRANGASEEEIRNDRAMQSSIYDILKSGADTSVIARKVREVYRERIAALPDSVRAQSQQPEAIMERQVGTLVSPWFMRFLVLDPKTYLRKVTCPVMAINGELDLQVPWKQNLAAIEEALKEGGNPDVTTSMLPGLNHLFQTATTGSPSEYGTIEETFSPKALDAIEGWLRVRVIEKAK
jgi:uncharacterized protein